MVIGGGAMPDDVQYGWVEDGTFRCTLDVRGGDIDMLNHVNNAMYFRYFEEARLRMALFSGLHAEGVRTVVLAHASCDFLSPLLYPARITVGLEAVRLGRSSLELDGWIAPAADVQQPAARGRHVVVCTERATGRPTPWPEQDLQALARCFPGLHA